MIENLRGILRKTFIMSLLADKFIIAVVGTQGVGKSRFMKNLYNLSDDDLKINEGIGERIPILFTEKDIDLPKYFCHQTIKTELTTEIKKNEIDRDTFIDKCYNYGIEDMILEIEVPESVFYSDRKHFLLLPGFESPNDYLKSLTNHSLRAASTCVVIFYREKYSEESNRLLIKSLLEDFNSTKPVFIITMIDIPDESDEDFRKKVIKELNISEGETSRVILAGSPGPARWRENTIDSILTNATSETEYLTVQIKNIKSILDEVQDITVDIDNYLDRLDIINQNKEYSKIERVLKLYDSEATELRKLLAEELKNSFDIYFNKVVEKIKDKIKGDDYWDKIYEFFRNPVAVQVEFENMIKKSIEEANDFSIEENFYYVLNRVQNRCISKIHFGNLTLPTDHTNQYDTRIVLVGEVNNRKEITLNENIIKDWKNLFGLQKDENFTNMLETAIRVLPPLGLEAMRVTGLVPSTVLNSDLEVPFKSNYKPIDLVNQYQNNRREFSIGLGILFGLDVIPDGEFDLFGLLQSNAATPAATGTSSAAATTVGTINWVAASLVTSIAVIYLVDQINKAHLSKLNTATLSIDAMKQYIIEHFLREYDKYILMLRNIIRERLRTRFSIDKQFAEIQNINNTIKQLSEYNRNLKKECNEFAGKMGFIL